MDFNAIYAISFVFLSLAARYDNCLNAPINKCPG